MKPGNHLFTDRNGANSYRGHLVDEREKKVLFSPLPTSEEFFLAALGEMSSNEKFV
jgi:hypothetical protein